MTNPYLVGSPPSYLGGPDRRIITSGGSRGIDLTYFDKVKPPAPELAQPIAEANEFYVAAGATWTYQPAHRYRVTTGVWFKSYGPDCVQVNPRTGYITFNTNLMPVVRGYRAAQTLHIGVKLRNSAGVSEAVYIVHIGKISSEIHRVGPTRTHTNLLSLMTAGTVLTGHTVVVDDGTYTGDSNRMYLTGGGSMRMFPGGTAAKYTDIIGRTPGEWIFDGQNVSANAVSLAGDEPSADWNNDGRVAGSYRNWTQIQGLRTINCTGSSISAGYCAYVIFRHIWPGDAKSFSGTHSVSVTHFDRCHHILGEYVHCMGYGRYLMSSYQATDIVFKRCVGFFAPYFGDEPNISAVSFYRARRCYAINCSSVGNKMSRVYLPSWSKPTNQYTTDIFQVASTGALSYSYDNHFIRPLIIGGSSGAFHSAVAEVSASEWGFTANDPFVWDLDYEDGVWSEHGLLTGYMARLYNGTFGKLNGLAGIGNTAHINGGRTKRFYDCIWHDESATLPHTDHWANVGGELYEDGCSRGNFTGTVLGPTAAGYPATHVQTNAKTVVGSIANGLQYPGRFEAGSVLGTDGVIGARQTTRLISVQGTFLDDPDFMTEITGPNGNLFPHCGADRAVAIRRAYTFYHAPSGMPMFYGNTQVGAEGEEYEYYVNTTIRESSFPVFADAQAFVDGTTKVFIAWLPFPDKYKNRYTGFTIYRNGTSIGTAEFLENTFIDSSPVAVGTDTYTIVAHHASDGASGHSSPVTARAV